MDVNKGDFVDGSAISNAMVSGATGEALSPIILRNFISVPLSDSLTSINGYKLLWSNPNPNEAYPASVIDIDISDYAFLLVFNRWWASSGEFYLHPLLIDVNSLRAGYVVVDDVPGSTYIYRRSFGLADDGMRLSIRYCVGFQPWSSTSQIVANERVVPTYIYGIK